MQTPKARSSSSEGSQKISPRAARQLKPAPLDTDSASSSRQAGRVHRESPKPTERRSPKSAAAPERKRPSKISELESQIFELREDLKKVREQLTLSESCKKQAQQDAEESNKELLALSAKLEDTKKQLQELTASGEAHVSELLKVSQEQNSLWQSKLEELRKQHTIDSAALSSAMNEIQQLKIQLELVAESEAAQTKDAELGHSELQNLKENLTETLSIVEIMKSQFRDCKESEAQAQALVSETLLQLETAKKTVEVLRVDAAKAVEAYNSIASELEHSRARVNVLEALVGKIDEDVVNNHNSISRDVLQESNQIEAELLFLKSEVQTLRSALEAAETKYHEEQIQSTVRIRNAYELVDQIKSESGAREAEIEAELKKGRADIEELKANLMDKETELQGIVEENEDLHLKIQKNYSCKRESELEKELKKLKESVIELRAILMDKETTLQRIAEENDILKFEINKSTQGVKTSNEVVAEVEAAKAAEREAIMRLGIVMEEADKSNRKAARVAEQLEAAQAANSELEADLRRLTVQSEQWRKAAEAAASMLSAGNNGRVMERTGSMDSNFNPYTGKCSPFSEDIDDDLQKKRHGNMLRKFGGLWKKPQK